MKVTNNLIWELIEESFKQEENSLYKKISDYYLERINPMINSNFKTVKEYLIDVYGIKKYHLVDENSFVYKVLTDKDKNGIFKRSDFYQQLTALIQDQIDRNKFKLKCSVFGTMAGINIKDCHKLEFRRSVKGFQGVWGFTTVEGEKATFETKAVFASGPIKCDHYRYISHIIGNTNIQTDNRLKNEILKKLKEENPELKKKLTTEEKELKKRTEKAEAEVKNSKWWYEQCLSSIERNKKNLAELSPEKLLGVKEELRKEYCEDLRNDYTKDLSYNENQLPKILKRVQQAEAELALVKATDLVQVNKEMTEKKDKKRIKELKDKLNSSIARSNASELQEELDSLYVKYPEIKAKDIRSKIKNYQDMIKYAEQRIGFIPKFQNPNEVQFQEERIKQYKEEIAKLKTA